jgi:hypothetical protein
MKKVYVDGLLQEWGEKFFSKRNSWAPPGGGGRPHPAGTLGRGRNTAARPKVSKASGGGGSAKLDARDVRGRLRQLVNKKTPQVMVKIYKGGRGMKQIRTHMRYISRAGAVVVVDQDGIRTEGMDAVREIAEDWKYGRVTIEELSERREAVNVVLSMPEGTDPIAVQKAARDFAGREFANHKYVMALHTIDTPAFEEDKNDPPSPNPHVHLIVQSLGLDGTRLNPRKADLHRWREDFAQALREHGVEAAATSRIDRLHRPHGEKQVRRKMKERGAKFTKPYQHTDKNEIIRKAEHSEKAKREQYVQAARILMGSDEPSDQLLAQEMAARFDFERPTPPPPEREPYRRTGTDDRER